MSQLSQAIKGLATDPPVEGDLPNRIEDCLRELRRAKALWSAEIESSAARREDVFVMQPAKDRIGMDGIRFSAAMTRIWVWEVKIGERRIRDTGTQGHMWTRPIVMGNPRFQDRP